MSKIIKEMRPNGDLRDEIKTLIREGGVYIIVSSTDFTTERTIKSRIESMEKGVSDQRNHQNLHLDFFDCGRVASWVR